MSEPNNMNDAMAKWVAACTPGDHHKRMEAFVGTWDMTRKMNCGSPDGKPAESKGRAVKRIILGGRWLIDETKGEFMGQPHESISYLGYDNFRKRYVGSYIDNLSTMLFTSVGGVDADGIVFCAFGTMDEPMTGEVEKYIRYVSRIVDTDTHTFEIYSADCVPERLVQEITYRRVK